MKNESSRELAEAILEANEIEGEPIDLSLEAASNEIKIAYRVGVVYKLTYQDKEGKHEKLFNIGDYKEIVNFM